ncbi:MAG TPA: polymorphic toxin type 46 domain-containing protein [Gammaproteobacteria bacterium]|nr:polymorphic toxin type 46 domain-containing protein [Gammaproteobacteria bacterium]
MEGRLQPRLNQLMANAESYLTEQLTLHPDYYPFVAAQTALATMQKIIYEELEPIDAIIRESDIGLLAAKSIDQIDFQNDLILHELSYEFLDTFSPQLLPASPGSGWNFAFQFYAKEGYDPPRIYSHLRGIDFNKPVTIQSHAKNHKIQQWRISTVPQGDYYAEIGVDPTELGINPHGQDLRGSVQVKHDFVYEALRSIDMLQSIADGIIDFWSIPGKSFPTKGGAIQYFKCRDKSSLREVLKFTGD